MGKKVKNVKPIRGKLISLEELKEYIKFEDEEGNDSDVVSDDGV